MSRLAELNPQPGDIVRIKFKSINQIMHDGIATNKHFHDVEDYYDIQSNLKAYLSGGDFLVSAALCKDEGYEDDPHIEIKNHMDAIVHFPVHESILESIELTDAAETFMSHDLKMIAVRIGHEMFINGHPMIWDESSKKDDDDEWKNHNRKLLRMFESFIADLAVQDAFKREE